MLSISFLSETTQRLNMGLVLPPYSPSNCYKPLICRQWNLMASGPEAAFLGRKGGTEELKQMVSPAALSHWPAVWPSRAHLSGSFGDVVGHTGHRDKRVFPLHSSHRDILPQASLFSLSTGLLV